MIGNTIRASSILAYLHTDQILNIDKHAMSNWSFPDPDSLFGTDQKVHQVHYNVQDLFPFDPDDEVLDISYDDTT